ncbi:MAG: hypothetical protein AB7Q16_18310 [Vicinamibacterales bacterium]
MKPLTPCFLVGLLLIPAVASAQTWLTVDFQDSLPFTATVHTPGDTGHNISHINSPGSCAPGVFWNYTRVAPGPANGGYNNRGHVRYTWCDYDVSRSGDASQTAGFIVGPGYLFEPGGTGRRGMNNWPTTFYGRLRIYIERPMLIHPNGGERRRQLKFFLWHSNVYDGDQRVIAFLENGQNCGQSDASHSCFTLQRNINHYTDSATVALAVGTWHHLQFSWRHGPQGVSYVKVWRDNNDFSNPTAQDTALTGVPSRPGGTSEWVKDNVGYDEGLNLGNAANQGTRFAEDFVYRMMDFQIGGTFDSTWSTGAVVWPTAPRNLRVNPPPD